MIGKIEWTWEKTKENSENQLKLEKWSTESVDVSCYFQPVKLQNYEMLDYSYLSNSFSRF